MRGLIIWIPASLAFFAFCAGLIRLYAEYGWHTVAFVMIALGGAYIVGTIARDWSKITGEEPWVDGDPVNYRGENNGNR